jgi:excinuclease UvrABC nuclease subunit|tara:strand:+ start:51 stop:566 length:516 start_codon:yes stop_codon:yes gene_type:complete
LHSIDLKKTIKFIPFKKQYCVYFLIHKKQIVYIGCSNNIFSRLNLHSKITPKCSFQGTYFAPKVFTHFRHIILDNKKRALKYEQRWIKKFNPKYNTVGRKCSEYQYRIKIVHDDSYMSRNGGYELWKVVKRRKKEKYKSSQKISELYSPAHKPRLNLKKLRIEYKQSVGLY